jgi:hypothetical protein
MPTLKRPARKSREETPVQLEPAAHRRILNFLNQAVQPQDLINEKLPAPNPEMDLDHVDHEVHERTPEELSLEPRKILDADIATEIIDFREREYPLGFRHVKEVLELKAFNRRHLDILHHFFSNSFFGSWSIFPQDIPRRTRRLRWRRACGGAAHRQGAVHHRG